MFKRVEIWILYLIILISIFITISFGVLVRQGLEGTTKAGNFSIEFLTKPAVYIARIPENFFSAFIQNIMVINDRWKPNRDFYSQKGFKFYNLNQSKSENYYLLLSKYESLILQLIQLPSVCMLGEIQDAVWLLRIISKLEISCTSTLHNLYRVCSLFLG